MREHTTRLLAFVVLLLCVATVVTRQWAPVLAASQREQAGQVFMPIVPIQEPANEDLRITHLGLYQSVQNQSNGVTLVARKAAMLRVHAESTKLSGNTSSAIVTIQAFRDGASLGSLSVGPQPVSRTPSAEDLASTFNADLPLDWLRGSLTLKVTIDKDGVVMETDEANNVFTSTFDFRDVPALDLTIVPVTYIDTVTGKTFSESGHDPISGWLMSAYPLSEINVAIRDPFRFTGDLRQGAEWSRLLSELTTVWAAEAGPGSSRIFYGLVPNSAPGGDSWFSGGVSGLGWLGQRVSVGLNMGEATGKNAGHEIGHNLGRKHAPCGNPTNVDLHFPYPNASIGVIGVDTEDETLLDPRRTHDVMSYCGPEWVSDYTYEALFLDQTLRGSRSGRDKGEGWLVQATIEDGQVTALPIQRIDQPFMPVEASDYLVQVLDVRGHVVGSYPATLYEAEEEGASAHMLLAHIPAAGLNLSSVRILDNGEVIAEQSIDGTAGQ